MNLTCPHKTLKLSPINLDKPQILKVCDYKIHHFPAGIVSKFHRHYQKHHFQTTLILVISSQCEQRATSNQLHKDGRRLARF